MRRVNVLRFLTLTICAALASIARAQTRSAGPVAFVNVSVIPMDRDRVLAAQTVIVENGVIREVGPVGSVKVPRGAAVVDGERKFLIPGLVDVHVHLAGSREIQLALLELDVATGVTTILNMRGTPEHLALRSQIASGAVFGPTLYTVGPYVNAPFVTTPDSVEREVVAQKRAGYDFVKLHGDLSREAYSRLMAVGRREGIRVIGHAPRNLGLDVMFRERQYAVAHAEEFLYDTTNNSGNFRQLEPRLPDLARRMSDAGIWLMPNLTAYKIIGLMAQDLNQILARPEMQYLPAPVRTGWGPATNPYTQRFGPATAPGFFARHAMLQKLTRVFDSTGVKLLVGTDAFNTGVVPGFSTHDELLELVKAGLTPFTALRAATANAAEFLGDKRRGIVAAGNKADLVLLDRNPLKDISNTRAIAGVMLRGRWIARAEIARMLRDMRS